MLVEFSSENNRFTENSRGKAIGQCAGVTASLKVVKKILKFHLCLVCSYDGPCGEISRHICQYLPDMRSTAKRLHLLLKNITNLERLLLEYGRIVITAAITICR